MSPLDLEPPRRRPPPYSESPEQRATLNWNEVRPVAEAIFSVWVGQPEMKWAELALGTLREAGLTGYDSEIDRHRVLVRVLALARIYREFCAVAWDETFCMESLADDWRDPAESHAELEPFWLGYLAGAAGVEPGEPGKMLHGLVGESRGHVVEALRTGVGNVNTLFASLWCSADPDTCELPRSEQERIALAETDVDEAGKAYAWVADGMPCGPSDD